MGDPKRTLNTLELVGGTLCFDFANTINSRRDPAHEYLATYSDIVDWAAKVGMLSAQQVKSLKQKAGQSAKQADAAFDKGKTAREVMYHIFSAIAARSNPRADDLNALTQLYQEAVTNGRLVKLDKRYEIDWKMDETLASPLWPIISSAEKLLSSNDLTHVKECPGCGWLFLDTSKNQSRRWCSMDTCGVRDKMQRYHKRLKK